MLGIAIVVATLVFLDARKRLPRRTAVLWALAVLGTAATAAPLYLLARPTGRSAWGLSEIVALPIFFAVSLIPITLIVARLFLRREFLSSIGMIVGLTVLQNAIFVAASLYVVIVKYHLRPASIGLGGGPWRWRLLVAAAASGLALVGNFVGQNLTIIAAGLFIGQKAATELVTRQEIHSPVFRLLQEFHRPGEVAMLAVLVGLIVPIGEEIFFRGLTYGALRRMLNRHAAVLISAAFFAAAHLEPVEFLPILILGVILAYLYDYTGSLVPGMIAHSVNNLAALALFYLSPTPSP